MSENKTERNLQLEVINNIVRICKGYHDCDDDYIAMRKYIKLCYDLYNKNKEDTNDESIVSDKDIYQFLMNNLCNDRYVSLDYEKLYKEVVDLLFSFNNCDKDEDKNEIYFSLSSMLMHTMRNVIVFTGNEPKEQSDNKKEETNDIENDNIIEDVTD